MKVGIKMKKLCKYFHLQAHDGCINTYATKVLFCFKFQGTVLLVCSLPMKNEIHLAHDMKDTNATYASLVLTS